MKNYCLVESILDSLLKYYEWHMDKMYFGRNRSNVKLNYLMEWNGKMCTDNFLF